MRRRWRSACSTASLDRRRRHSAHRRHAGHAGDLPRARSSSLRAAAWSTPTRWAHVFHRPFRSMTFLGLDAVVWIAAVVAVVDRNLPRPHAHRARASTPSATTPSRRAIAASIQRQQLCGLCPLGRDRRPVRLSLGRALRRRLYGDRHRLRAQRDRRLRHRRRIDRRRRRLRRRRAARRACSSASSSMRCR